MAIGARIRLLHFMRIACPLAFLAAVTLGSLAAWTSGNPALVAINAFLAGVNLVLTLINWFWFKP